MWDRWQKGETLHQIAGYLIDTTHRYSGFWLSQAGYARPTAPIKIGIDLESSAKRSHAA